MAPSTNSGHVSGTAEQRVDELLFQPDSVREFLAGAWQRVPYLLRRNDTTYYNRIVSEDALYDLLEVVGRAATERHTIAPLMQLVGGERAAGKVTLREAVHGPNEVIDAYRRGGSVLIAAVQRYCPSLQRLCLDLEQVFRSPVTATFIDTPPNAQAFGRHFDVADSLVLQLVGRKSWRVLDAGAHFPIETLPRLPFESFDDMIDRAREAGRRPRSSSPPVLVDTELLPGDLLYIPRGIEHDVWTGADTHSMHVTIAIQPVSYLDLILAGFGPVVARVEELRQHLPPSPWDSAAQEAMREKARRLIAEIADTFDADVAIDAMTRPLGANSSTWADVPDALKRRRDHVPVDLESVLTHVGAPPRIDEDEFGTSLMYGERRFAFPSEASDAISYIAATRRFAVKDVPGLTDDSKLTVCGRLLRAHVLRVERGGSHGKAS